MKLGFVAVPTEDNIRMAGRIGFDGMEVALGRWAGQGNDMTAENARKARGLLDKNGLKALTVQLAENYCDGGEPVDRMKKSIEAAGILGTRVVTVNAWVPAGLKPAEKFDYYKKVWSEFAKLAEDNGVRIGIENCPHGGVNLGSCVRAFERMFELVPSKAIGLEFDPSHFIFQFMDYISAIRRFGDRVFAFHAKDTQIMRDRLDAVGIYGDRYLDEWWWRFRMPGYGDVDWKAVFVALSDIKYAGDIIIEHEDPSFEGEEGLRRGHKFLRQYMMD